MALHSSVCPRGRSPSVHQMFGHLTTPVL
jgi:hypothetical protein